MKIQDLNEVFIKRYFTEEFKMDSDTLRKALNDRVKELINKRITNPKQYELALIDELEKQFPNKSWQNITDCKIFDELVRTKDAYEVVDLIISKTKENLLQDDAEIEDDIDGR